MKLLRFMIRKDMAKSAFISLLLALLSCAFLISVLRPSYAYGEKYITYLKGGSETVSQDAQKLADEQNALNNEINDYQNNHNTGGVKQAELPAELEEKIIDFSQKNSQAGVGLDSMFSLIEGELYSQQNALKLISERVRGYSRNARRGVTDEYSLKLSNKLIEDYDSVITTLEKSDKIIDTRAADGYENYMSSEILIPFGVYLLLFSIFSSEIQSGRIKSFGITKTGVRKFSLFKLCTGFVAVIILVLIIYTVDIITLLIYDTNGFKLSMPLQYLSGFELSSANMSFGGYIAAVFAAKLAEGVDTDERVIGETTESYEIKSDNYTISLDKLQTLWEGKLEPVYPVHVKEPAEKPEKYSYKADKRVAPAIKVAKPKVLIPVFPGTNCEYDTARAFEKAGAEADIFVVRNLTEQAIKESVDAMEKKIKESQIVMLPGGFSGGDEPDGSGKFIVSFLRNPRLTDAIHDLLKNRDGLMLGICNGFQALIKLGLVPYGEIRDMRDDSPTLTFNTIARHQSKMVNTRIASNKSPWLAGCEVGDIHSVAISHGEGRFVATAEEIAQLAANGQIATQYVDFDGEPTFDIHCNPNTSFQAIEGITSPDGRVLGKMGHSERKGCCVSKNVPGEKDQKIFESGVAYFK